jgi:hypothetical protein
VKSHDNISGRAFRTYGTSLTVPFLTKAFLHLNPHHFLLVLSPQQVETSSNTNDTQLSNDGYQIFKDLKRGYKHFQQAIVSCPDEM